MEKHSANYLIFICFILIAVLLGYFLGKNLHYMPIQVSQKSPTNSSALELTQSATFHRININTATQEELQMLPGIGETLAARIVAYRTEHGPFRLATELIHVEGIGTTRLEALLDYITVGG